MRLRVKVSGATGKTRHYIGDLDDGRLVPIAEIPAPFWVEISAEDGAFYLFRLDDHGGCLADTWHQTLEEAKRQATFEFGVAPGDWADVERS